MSEERPVIRCAHCRLNQFVAERCRRCKQSLLLPLCVDIKEVLENPTQQINFGDVLPSMRQWQMSLIYEALKRAKGSKRRAAELIDVDHTTIWKKLKESETAL